MPRKDVNPYIAGSAVKGAEMFFGRDDVFDFIRQNLVGPHSNNPIVLYGQRRLGKTSILYQLHRHLDAGYWCVFIDLHGLDLSSMANLMRGIAIAISASLRRDQQIVVEVPSQAAFAADPAAAFEMTFLDQILGVLGSKQLVLMLDEAIRLDEEVRAGRLDSGIFAYMRHLMQHSQRLNFIFSLGSGIEEMAKDYALLFNGSLYHRISFLKPQAARDLIIRPAEDRYRVTDQATDLILKITSGHPYYTQLVCHCLFDAWVQGSTDTVEASDVHDVLAEAIELGSANLTYAWQDSTLEEQVFMAGLASAMSGESTPVTVEQVRNAWSRLDVGVPPQEITRALRGLISREVIAGGDRYSFTVDLLRLWIDKHRQIDWVKDEIADVISEWKASAQVNKSAGRVINGVVRNPSEITAGLSGVTSPASDMARRRPAIANLLPDRLRTNRSVRRAVLRLGLGIGLIFVIAALIAVVLFRHFAYRPAMYAGQSQNPAVSGARAAGPAVSAKQIAVLSDPRGYLISDVAFSSDEKTIAASARRSNGDGGNIDLWNSIGKLKRSLNDPGNSPGGVAFSPTSPSILAVADVDGVRLWNLTTSSVHAYTDSNSDTITYAAVAFTRDGTTIAAANFDGNVYLLDTVDGQWFGNRFRDAIAYARQFDIYINQVAVSPAGNILAVADSAGDVYVWSISGGSPLLLTGEVTNSIDALAFSPNGKTLAVVGNSSIRLLDLTTKKFLAPLAGLGKSSEAVAFTRDGATLVVGDIDGTVHFWDLASRKDTTISTLAYGLSGLAVSPDGRTFAVFGSQAAKLYLYSVQYAS